MRPARSAAGREATEAVHKWRPLTCVSVEGIVAYKVGAAIKGADDKVSNDSLPTRQILS